MRPYRVAWWCLSLFLFVTFPEAKGEFRKAQEAAAAAIRLKPSHSTSLDTKFVSCFGKGQSTGSVEVEATAFRPKDEPPAGEFSCENTSRLFIAGPGDSQFKLVYSQSPPDISDGNSLKLVDWSADGANLLVERTIWGYETEGEMTDLVLFAASSRAITVPDLPKILEARFGNECGSENSVLGFTPEGNVLVLVAPVKDTYYNQGATSCVKKKTQLALDGKRSLQAVAKVSPADSKTQHYGHYLERQHPAND